MVRLIVPSKMPVLLPVSVRSAVAKTVPLVVDVALAVTISAKFKSKLAMLSCTIMFRSGESTEPLIVTFSFETFEMSLNET